MPELPQELIDAIIDHVYDRRTLKACSLVCSQWSARSRKYLFARVQLSSETDFRRWYARIRPGPSGPSSLVKCLYLAECHLRPRRVQLESFSGLRTLIIRRWKMSIVQASSMLQCLGPLLKNVTRLTLGEIFFHPLTLATFVSHFPRLRDLSIENTCTLAEPLEGTDNSCHWFHDGVVPTYPHREFTASGPSRVQRPKEILEGIILLEPRFRRISLEYADHHGWRDFWPLIEACGGSLEVLHICVAMGDADCSGLSLACCPNLRTISLLLDYDQPPQLCQLIEKCLSTVTSTQLSRVSFTVLRHMPGLGGPSPDSSLWESPDVALYNLAGQYQPRHKGDRMLVEFIHANPALCKTANFLRRYRERGTLRLGFWT